MSGLFSRRQDQPTREVCSENAPRVASHLLTVVIEHGVLVLHLVSRLHQTRGMSRSEIAGVGVSRHEAERGAFAAAGQNERWRWLLQGRWDDAFSLGAVMLAPIREWLRPPHAADDLD